MSGERGEGEDRSHDGMGGGDGSKRSEGSVLFNTLKSQNEV